MAELPELVGLAEITGMLGVSRTRVYELSQRPDWPQPVAHLQAGKIYTRADIEAWQAAWPRRNGRPRKPCACQSPGEMIT